MLQSRSTGGLYAYMLLMHMYEPANICEVLCYTVRWTITKVVRIGTDLISDLIKKKVSLIFE